MKQFFLSFAVMLLLSTSMFAQNVTVVNNTGCDVEVSVNGYPTGPCSPTSIVPSPIVLSSTNSQLFSGYNEYEISVVIDPTSTSSVGPLPFSTAIAAHVGGACTGALPVDQTDTVSQPCGGANSQIRIHTDYGVNATVNIDPL